MLPSGARALLIAEAANPEWVSVPLVGWSLSRALVEATDAHVVTQVRNRDALLRAGWTEGREFTVLDSEPVARPMWLFDAWLRRLTGLGWTTSQALSAFPYYYFEHLLWRRFGAAIERREFSVVHRITPLSPTIPSLVARRCRRAGVPFVWGPINGGIAWPPGFEGVIRAEGEWLSYLRGAHRLLPESRATRSAASAIIVASKATLSELGPYADKCVYIPENAVDPARFPRPARAPAAGGPLRVVFIGRLVPYKGADILLEAAAPLVREGAVSVEIIGDGPQRPQLEALIAAQGLGAGTTLAGWIPNEKLAAHLAGADVLGFPSVREFGGGVVLEAMALGLVPVVVDYGGPGELVTERTGFRVPIGTRAELVAAFRERLSRLASDRASIPALSASARARVEAWFTWPAKARQVLAVHRWVRGEGLKPDFGTPFPDASPTPQPMARG
ncbi:MAG TPA: glycosyltransferase family 4 protein [Polyangia bacterium]|nr:glycosyltransferase family 4 protein [Polyangia bacterium]